MKEETRPSYTGSYAKDTDSENFACEEDSLRRQNHLDFMRQDGFVVEKQGLRLSHYALSLLDRLIRFISIVVGIILLASILASVLKDSVGPVEYVAMKLSLPIAAFLGLRLILAIYRNTFKSVDR